MNQVNYRIYLLLLGIGVGLPVFGTEINWIAQTPNNDMYTASNWSSGVVPGSSDEAIFDSTLTNVSTNPTEQSASFSVSSIQFPNSASAFTFYFNNQSLLFSGAGITGSQTNLEINSTNIDNLSSLDYQIAFNGINSSSNSAFLNVANSATQSDSISASFAGVINHEQVYFSSPFTLETGGNLTAENQGEDSSLGSGGNQTAYVTSSQMLFDDALTVQDSTTMTLSNNGTSSGSSSTGSQIGYVADQMTQGTGPSSSMNAGNEYSLIVTNIGSDTSNGSGGNSVAVVGVGSQSTFNGLFTSLDTTVLSMANSGTNSGNTISGNSVGIINNSQLHLVYQANMQNNANIEISNEGVNSRTGSGGNSVGKIASDSQLRCDSLLTLGNNAALTISNSGINSGDTISGSNIVGFVQNFQAHLSGGLVAGDAFQFSVTNSGQQGGASSSSDNVGIISSHEQVRSESDFQVGNNANISIANSGTSSSSTTGHLVGYVGASQFDVERAFTAGTDLM